MTPARLEAWLTRGLGALSVALVGLLLLVSDGQIVSQDLPAQVVPLNVALHPDLYPDLTANLPTSQLVFNGLVLALGGLVPLRWAVVVTLLIGLLGWVAAWAAIARRLGGHPWATAAVAAGAWLGWLHVMGFHNYLFGNLFCVVAAAVALHRPTVGGRAAAAALLVVAAFAHPFAALHGIGLWLLAALASRPIRSSLRHVLWLFPAGAVAKVALLQSYLGQGSVQGLDVLATGWQWGQLPGRLLDLVGTSFVAYHPFGWVLGAAVLAVAFASPAVADASVRRPVIAVVLGGLLVALLAPTSGLGWAWVGQRLAVLPLLVAVAAVSTTARPGLARAVALALCLVAAVRAGLEIAAHRPASAALAASVEAFGDAPVGRTFAVWVQQPVAVAAPHAMVDVGTAGWAALNGGMLPGMFATTPSIHWALFTAPVAELIPEARQMFAVFEPCGDPGAHPGDCAVRAPAAAQQVALAARWFESVVLVHPEPAMVAGLEQRGFVPVAPAVLRVATSTLVVTLPAGFDAPDPVAQIALPDGTPVAQAGFATNSEGRGSVTLTHLLAGDAVLRVGSGSRLLLEQPITLAAGATRTLVLGGEP